MNWQALSALVGRVLIGIIYIASGLDKVFNYAGTGQYMASENMPMIPVLLPAAIAVEIVFGLGVVVGFKTRISALVLAAYSIVATMIFNHFWTMDGQMASIIMHLFMSTIVMVGACLFVAGMGPGPFALENSKSNQSAA